MGGLADIIAKQKAAKAAAISGGKDAGTQTDVQRGTDAGDSPVAAPVGVAGGATAPVKSASRLTFGVKAAAKPSAAPAQPKPASVPQGPATSPNDPRVAAIIASIPVADEADPVDMTLDDLNALDVSTVNEVSRFRHEDEIPCTAPTRELPEDLTRQQKLFVDSLDSIYTIVHDPDLFGGMIRTIMQELQENPEYVKLMGDTDVHTLIRGLRESMGMAQVKKAEKTRKAPAGKKISKAVTDSMLSTLDELNASDWG